ncbi:MAG: CRTAC1 family protein [Planctomycetes bacterium]|nr:CRTAC1 family protein [Planctomycetota bacterium]
MKVIAALLVMIGIVALAVLMRRGGADGPVPTGGGGDHAQAESPAAPVRPPLPPLRPPAAAATPDQLIASARTLIDVINVQESAKDATCWTTVRLMDAHFANRRIPEAVALAKIEACKRLVYAVWRKASQEASGPLTAAQIESALPKAEKAAVSLMTAAVPFYGDDPVCSVMNRDYHRITENKRSIYAITADAIAGSGVFAGRPIDICPLSDAGVNSLAAAATVMTVSFITAASRSAAAHENLAVEEEDVRDALVAIASDLALDVGSEPAPEASRGTAEPPMVLRELTALNIQRKVVSLRSWNKRIWPEGGSSEDIQLGLINRFTKIPFDAGGYRELRRSARGFIRQIAGDQPDQARYLGLTEVSAGLDRIFPHQILVNGDILVLVHAPADPTITDRIVMLDWELDAIRDSTVHWSIMEEEWQEAQALPLDPFAAELMADRMSELLMLFIRRCEAAARADGVATISGDTCAASLAGITFGRSESARMRWTPKDRAEKARLMASYASPLFKDVTAQSGLFFKRSDHPSVPHPMPARPGPPGPGQSGEAGPLRSSGPTGPPGSPGPGPQRPDFINGELNLITDTGSGIAVGDFDSDGRTDIFLPGNGGNRLYRNIGDRRFEDVTARLHPIDDDTDDAHHALLVDYDNDGRLDLLIVHAVLSSHLYHQNPSGDFDDVTQASGLDIGKDALSALCFDYDNDEYLDIYISRYGAQRRSLDGRNGSPNQMFHNLGNGRFEDVSLASGTANDGFSLASSAIDVNGDGLMDLFVANDFRYDNLYINRGNGVFSEDHPWIDRDDRGDSMSASVVDVDGDGRMDIYISQINTFSKSIGFVFPEATSQIVMDYRTVDSLFYIATNQLFRNDGSHFSQVQDTWFEPADRGWSWGATFFDYENDGDEDMYLCNGWRDGTTAENQQNHFYLRQANRYFLSNLPSAESYKGNSRTSAAVDLTGTGRADLIVTDFHMPARVLANMNEQKNHWLKVALIGTRTNRFGIGAVIRLKRSDGSVSLHQIDCGVNFLSQCDAVHTFGLGAKADAEEITVTWPGNHVQVVHGPFGRDTRIEITEPAQ